MPGGRSAWRGRRSRSPTKPGWRGRGSARPERLIAIHALEAARCLAEGVVASPADIDLAAVFGAGFPPWTGGPISYVDTIGAEAFAESCRSLARRFGGRFDPSTIQRSEPERPATGHQAPPEAA